MEWDAQKAHLDVLGKLSTNLWPYSVVSIMKLHGSQLMSVQNTSFLAP